MQNNYFQNIYVNHGNGRYRVEALAVVCGNDIVVLLEGGEKWHIGATALAIPRPSLADSSQIAASTSVLCVPGHKEDDLIRRLSLDFASSLDCTVAVIGGIHIDNASLPEIDLLTENARCVFTKLIDKLRHSIGEKNASAGK
jgi:hypothetical protein